MYTYILYTCTYIQSQKLKLMKMYNKVNLTDYLMKYTNNIWLNSN